MKSYKLEIALDGANINLQISSRAKWVLGPDANFRTEPGTKTGLNLHIDSAQSNLRLLSDDPAIASIVLLFIYVETDEDSLKLNVALSAPTGKLVLVKSSVDSFAVQTPGTSVHDLKLK